MEKCNVRLNYLEKKKNDGKIMKVYLESGNGQPKTMLQGYIKDFDEECIVLDECLIDWKRVISITPFH